MGGSSLAPEVFAEVFGAQEGGLRLSVLDTTVPAEIIALEQTLDLKKTLFIVASKSGTTIETTSHLAYFWDRIKDGANFVAITDPGTSSRRWRKSATSAASSRRRPASAGATRRCRTSASCRRRWRVRPRGPAG